MMPLDPLDPSSDTITVLKTVTKMVHGVANMALGSHLDSFQFNLKFK